MRTLPGTVRCLKFARAGTYLYAGNDHGEIVVFDLGARTAIAIDVIKSQQSRAIWSIDISYDDAIVVLGTESGTIEMHSQEKILYNAGDQLQDLTKKLKKTEDEQEVEPNTTPPSLLKTYQTKAV